jgi:hypothetical protein
MMETVTFNHAIGALRYYFSAEELKIYGCIVIGQLRTKQRNEEDFHLSYLLQRLHDVVAVNYDEDGDLHVPSSYTTEDALGTVFVEEDKVFETFLACLSNA